METYLSLAKRDYKSANLLMKGKDYNIVAQTTYLCCEKMLKHHIEENNKLTDNLSRTHNLKNLYREVENVDKDMEVILRGLSMFYYSTSYPGPDFVNVEKEEAEDIIKVCEKLAENLGYSLDGKDCQINVFGWS